jgi:hypothetical protein
MVPEPVATERSTLPLTVSVRSKVASAAIAGTAAIANAAINVPVAAKKVLILYLDSTA